MNEIISYFSTIPSSHRSLILVGGITFFWLIENAFPLFNFTYKKWHHAGINLFMTFTTVLVNFFLAFILLQSADWTIANNFGILQWLPEMPLWLYALVGLLLLDLIGAYLVHPVEHRIKFLWRFHLIHHTDNWIDTTSANRHHPGGKCNPVCLYDNGCFNHWKSHVDGFPIPNTICCGNAIQSRQHFSSKKSRYSFELFYRIARHAQSTPPSCSALHR